MILLFRLTSLLLVILIPGCKSLQQGQINANTIAEQAGLEFEQTLSGQFLLTTYKKIAHNSNDLVVYIEGDGLAWKRKNILSDDPTPKEPVALKLTTRDPRNSILYIARPCQYLSEDQLKKCPPKYWATHRYAIEVIDSINNAIDKVKTGSEIHSISLVGFSGGGSVAVLVAAVRNDVSSIITIAANLDHTRWTELHNITPLEGSLNAANFVSDIEHIPQLHLVGGKDTIVPASIADSYYSKSGNPERINIRIIPDFNHQCCWVAHWKTLLCQNVILENNYCN